MYFRLRDIEYDISSCSVSLNYEDTGIRMYIEVNAETKNQEIDFELRNVSLYHNNGFNTGVQKPKQLENKKFVWDNPNNKKNEEAGYFYVVEHEDVTKGTIEILKVDKNNITIHWSGTVNIFWNSEFGENVPFDTEFTTTIPIQKKYKINALEKDSIKIGKNAELCLLNFDEVNEVRKKVDETKQWNDFNAELKFKVTYDGKDYFGKVVYKNGKINHKTYFDEKCPLDVVHETMGWSDVLNYVDFYFLVTEKG